MDAEGARIKSALLFVGKEMGELRREVPWKRRGIFALRWDCSRGSEWQLDNQGKSDGNGRDRSNGNGAGPTSANGRQTWGTGIGSGRGESERRLTQVS